MVVAFIIVDRASGSQGDKRSILSFLADLFTSRFYSFFDSKVIGLVISLHLLNALGRAQQSQTLRPLFGGGHSLALARVTALCSAFLYGVFFRFLKTTEALECPSATALVLLFFSSGSRPRL